MWAIAGKWSVRICQNTFMITSIRNPWADVVLPIAQGMIAHARCDRFSAIAHLRHALPKLQAVGGSHAQRNVFEQVYLNALLR
jgi:hypothetical protein